MAVDPYERLAFAIVSNAVKDYRKAATRLKKNHENYKAYLEIQRCEEFFQSEWCDMLCQGKFSGTSILNKLKEEAGDECYYKPKNRVSKQTVKTKKENRTHGRKSRRI